MESREVLVVGPSLSTQGGISSVLKIYKDNYSRLFNLRMVPSYSGHNRVKDLFYFLYSVILVFIKCITSDKVLFHFHTASKGSFLRKSLLARICFVFKKTVIFHIHGAQFDQFLESAGAKRRERIINLLGRSYRVIVLSRKWKEYFTKYLPEEKLEVIYNPSVTFQSMDLAIKYNNKVNVIFMGRLGERKGVYDLIEAVKLLKRDNFVVNIYGDGEVEKVRELVEKNNLNSKVKVNSWVPHKQISIIYDSADLLVLPSYAEGLPMSVLEAVGKGLPVIATNVGGIPEAVLDGENGYIVNPGDINMLAQKLEKLINNPDIRIRMGKRSLEIAQERFTIKAIEKKLIKLYSSVEA